MRWREHGEVRWLEAELPDAIAVFTTRPGGVSQPPFDSLNLGILTDDAREDVLSNRHRLADSLGIAAGSVLIGRQVHGTGLLSHLNRQSPSSFAVGEGDLPEVDGHLTKVEGLIPLVLVADCLPVALSGPGGVAMLHCGWRGLAGGIIERAVPLVGAGSAVIGPGIGPCCLEVGPEVGGQFAHLGEGLMDGRLLDLPEVARRLLRMSGVTDIESAGHCTSCEPDLFFSHRRDKGRTGRQAGLIWRRRSVSSEAWPD